MGKELQPFPNDSLFSYIKSDEITKCNLLERKRYLVNLTKKLEEKTNDIVTDDDIWLSVLASLPDSPSGEIWTNGDDILVNSENLAKSSRYAGSSMHRLR